MGNNTSKIDLALKSHAEVQAFSVESLGRVSTYRCEATGEMRLRLRTSYAIANQALAESELQQALRVNASRFSCKLLAYDVVKNQQFCLENYSLDLLFEFFPVTLHALITQQKKFTEREMWMLSESMMAYLGELKTMNVLGADFHPKEICCLSGGQFRFLSLLLFTDYQSAYRMKLAYKPYSAVLAPELLAQLRHNNLTPDHDPLKASIFVMGMCLLCAATATPFERFYAANETAVLEEEVKRALATLVSRGYSIGLFAFLDVCLRSSPFERPFLEDLQRKLPHGAAVTTSDAFWQR